MVVSKIKLFELDDDVEDNIAKAFNKTKQSLKEDVKEIQTWMASQPHLPEVMDENTIKNFLINHKMSLEVVKQKIDLYYTLKSRTGHLFGNCNPNLPQMKTLVDNIYCFPLPKLTKDLSRVSVWKIRKHANLEGFDPKCTFDQSFNYLEIRLKEDLQLTETFIADFEGFTAEMLPSFRPTLGQKYMEINTGVINRRVKAFYVVNASPITNGIFTVYKTMLKPKVAQRIHFCKVEELVDFIPKEILPVDYGGEEKSLEELNEIFKAKLTEYEERLEELGKIKVDESLRPQKLENDDMLGFHGNFKKLDLD